jgi:menaquinone reductase, molybdopterin-binding-like subunit
MPVDRRDFLKFILGGALGTVVSPLPWVSMDEVAKWSQRWAPIPEKGESAAITSICKLCPGGCGIRVRVIQKERAVKIDGNPNHPVNRGGLCPLGLAGLQYLYNDEIRVKNPMKRDGARGEGKWKSISWDEALSQIASRLTDLRKKDLGHTLVFLDGEGEGSQAQLVNRFLKAFGTPNYLHSFQSRDLEEVLTQSLHGVRAGLTYDLPNAQYILSFGSALLDGWGNPAWVAQAFQEWRGNSSKGRARLIQIEPIASTTASLADEWLPIKPGTEGILALGLAQIIIDKDWYNKEYVQSRASGLADLREFLNSRYAPEQVAGETELPKETLVNLAKAFSSAKQPLAVWGRGKGEIPVSLFEAQAVHLLNILSGSVNRPGGVYLQTGSAVASGPKLALDSIAEKGLSQPRADGALSAQYPRTGQRMESLFENVTLNKPYPVNVLMIYETNPAFHWSPEFSMRVLDQIPLVVSFSSFMDETTRYADLVLPVPTFLERWDDQINCLGVPYPVYGLVKPVLPPLYDTRPLGETILSLAKKLGGTVQAALPFENMESLLKQTAKNIYDSKKGRLADGPVPESGKYGSASFESFEKFWEQLVAQGAWYHLENAFEEGKGKWDLNPAPLKTVVPKTNKTKSDYPLWMIPQSLILLQSDYWANPPFMTKYLGVETLNGNRLVAQMHPQTAASLSLQEGQLVAIQSANGKITAQIHLFEGARPNCLFVPLGLGHRAFDPTLKDRGDNPYPILDTEVDPLTGLKVGWATRVKITKV